jgi:methylenetetrahydrofolate--tRNA-(uracil-5-)-methyltransferase
MAGVEGYVESAALGLLAGVNAAFAAAGETPPTPAPETAFGALLNHLMNADAKHFQPMNVNFGLFPPLAGPMRKLRKRAKNELLADRAVQALAPYLDAASANVQ